MDLLDNIESMMTHTLGKPKPKPVAKPKPKPTIIKKEVEPGLSTATPPPSFRIPKKSAAQNNSNNNGTSASPLSNFGQNSHQQDRRLSSCRMEVDDKTGIREPKQERGSYSIDRQVKQEYKPSVRTNAGTDFVIPRTLAIEMNGVNLDLSKAPEYVHRYHINIAKIKKNGDEKDATRGAKADLPTQQRRSALFNLFAQLVEEHPEYFGEDAAKHVYDLGNTFYSIGCKITQNDGDVVIEMVPDDVKCGFTKKVLFKGTKQIVITLQWTGMVYIKGPKQNEDDGTRREAARFFEVLTSQSLFGSNHHAFANKFFEGLEGNDVSIGEGKCVKGGFEKNVRFLGETDESAAPVLQVDTKKSPFYRSQSVLEFIGELTERNPEEALKSKNIRSKVAKDLRDLVVTTTHLNENRWFYIHGIVENTARSTRFMTDDGEISVEEYFMEKYKKRLRYPNLPMAAERRGSSGFNYHPLEVLLIEKGQRVDNKKLAGKLTEKMIQQARMLPHQMREHNLRQLRQANLIKGHNDYLDAFGIQTSSDFITTEAKVLSAPEIKYKSSTVEPDRSGALSWRTQRNTQFYQPATVGNVSLVIFDRAIAENDATEFFRALARAGRERGMVVQDNCVRVTNLSSELDSEIEEHFRSCAGKVSMIMCITREKKDPVHDFIKLMEARHKVVTQHIWKQTAMACSSPRGGAKTLENVLLKFNVKNGGINHTISAARAALGGGTSQQDINGRLFNGKMFVGFELSHAAAQSFYDRQMAEKVKEPTVVGFSYSCGQPTDYSGFWWYQEPRLHTILYLENHFHRAFEDYHKKNKRLPVEIVVFRSGTSEGEFAEVENEANTIRKLAQRMTDLNGGKPYRPKVTVIVSQTNSNYRIMPVSMPPANQGGGRLRAADCNVPSGTCADSGITHPRLREFIMTSQQANIGTSRPTRYTIVADEKPEMSLSEAEHITHFLCHGHQQSTLPTHVPAVLYAAENLAKRGRAAWKTKLGEDSDVASSSSAPRYSLADGETPDDFYKRISRELMSSLPNHYFA
ncbi:hypothetical protein Q1695_011294 [Nippostrongylus brasiliensis]|nr:hypothetical protein Q1695_011294 [Nippostrongylus brasiliensis]